jgi:hypothetical protein
MIREVGLLRPTIQLACENTVAPSLLKRRTNTTDTGKEVNERELSNPGGPTAGSADDVA